MVRICLLLLAFLVLFMGCYNDSPSLQDGDFGMELYMKLEGDPVRNLPVKISSMGYAAPALYDTTDELGKVSFAGLPMSEYKININGMGIVPSFLNPGEEDTILVAGSKVLSPDGNDFLVDSVETIASGSTGGIKINEIYSCGPPNNFFYFYDQFFELYNSSDDTLYLDGMIFCRMGKFLENVTYIFQFPGEPLGGTENYPIYPDSFVVVASDAYDHRGEIFNGNASVDLTNADFEFKNSLELNDPDNPDVPNLENLEVGHTLDFMVGVTGDVVLIADGSDVDYTDGIEMESVIDCVEWSSKSDHVKEIEDALDRGFGGVGQGKYSGTSLERISPGFDTNNSTIDFVIIPAPTPGYQHE